MVTASEASSGADGLALSRCTAAFVNLEHAHGFACSCLPLVWLNTVDVTTSLNFTRRSGPSLNAQQAASLRTPVLSSANCWRSRGARGSASTARRLACRRCAPPVLGAPTSSLVGSVPISIKIETVATTARMRLGAPGFRGFGICDNNNRLRTATVFTSHISSKETSLHIRRRILNS